MPYVISPAQHYGTLHTETIIDDGAANPCGTPVVVKRTYFGAPNEPHIVGDLKHVHQVNDNASTR